MKTHVDKADLISTLMENRDNHHDTFVTAIDRYRDRLIEEFTNRVELLKEGKDVQVYVNLPTPEDHTDDYDRILAMLALSVDEVIELDDEDVATYVQDNWAWKKAWMANTASYLKH